MAGVTETGFVRKLESEVFEEVLAELRATVDPAFDGDADSVGGQLVGVFGSKVAELWEVLEGVWGALSPNASGAALDRIAALTNTFRRAGEDDVALRLRRQRELADAGGTTQAAMRAALSRLAGMTNVRVFSNRTMVIDAAGRPPKSVEAVTLGSTPEATILATIWDNLSAGIEAHGTLARSFTDSEGHSQILRYSPAEAANWFVRVSAEVEEGTYAGDVVVKQTVRDFSSGALTLSMSNGRSIPSGFDIADILYRTRVAAAVLTVPGVTAVRQVQFRALATDPWLDTDLPLGPRQYLGVDGARGFALDRVEVVTT